MNNSEIMTTTALNNLWTYLKGLSLSRRDREWLASKLVSPSNAEESVSAEDKKALFLQMAGCWSENSEGDDYYKMMTNRNLERPSNPIIPSLDD